MDLPQSFYRSRRLETLVENKSSYCLSSAQINVYETHESAEKVFLQFDDFVLVSMIKGKKVMHLRDNDGFEFLPGESVIMPAKEIMQIDFPEAQLENPTRCLAMTISNDKIKNTLEVMNDSMPKADEKEWDISSDNFHFTNDAPIYRILQRLLFLFSENNPLKDVFLENMVMELIVRIMQVNSRDELVSSSNQSISSNRIAGVIKYIRENLYRQITIDELASHACMSKPNFYRVFKNELGMSPVDFILRERVRFAESMLKNPEIKIKEVFAECGFENRSYFNRVFKKIKRVSPSEYQSQMKMVV